MADYDCLLIGNNDIKFERFVDMTKSMGEDHVDYKDLSLNHILYKGKPYRAQDILTHFFYQDKNEDYQPFHNGDLLWSVIAYLGTYLHRKGFSFDFVNLFQLEKDRLREKLLNNNYLTIAVTATIYTYDVPILEVISFVRQYNKTSRIILGGPYISKRAETMEADKFQSILKYIDADIYVYSREGEQALGDVIKALKNNFDLGSIPNIAYRNDNHYLTTPQSVSINSLEENMIDYSLFPKEETRGFVNMRISDGCPYACSFCAFPERGDQKYKIMDIKHIEKEFDAIKSIGNVTHLFFMDGTINVPQKKFHRMLRMMIKNNYGFKWHCFFRADLCDEETVQLLEESGCEGVFLGLESANETVLRNMNKTAHKEDFRRIVPLLKKAGIIVMYSVIVGFPGETLETFQETLDFVEESEPDFCRFQMWYSDRTTPIWKQREKFGLKGENFGWSHDTMDSKTACDLVNKAFFSVNNVTWLPDPGYNFVSLYFMKRKGMSLERQRKFIKCWNAVVKEKLLHQNMGDISPGLSENLKITARFDQPGEPDWRLLEKYSGAGYTAAESFWLDRFKRPPASVDPDMSRPSHENPRTDLDRREVSRPVVFKESLLDRLQSIYDTDLATIILAAYSTLLLRLQGHEDTTIVTSMDEEEGFPVRLYPSWTLSFRDFVQEAEQKIRQAAAHRLYAFYILTNPVRLKTYGSHSPAFDTAILVTEQQEDNLEERLTYYPDIYRQISLVLRVIKEKNNDIKIQYRYSTGKYGPEAIEKLNTYLESILEEAAENPAILLKEIALEAEVEREQPVVEAHAAEDFNF